MQDSSDLLKKKVLAKESGGGRSTSYRLIIPRVIVIVLLNEIFLNPFKEEHSFSIRLTAVHIKPTVLDEIGIKPDLAKTTI